MDKKSHAYALTHVLRVDDSGTHPAPGHGHTPRQRASQEDLFVSFKKNKKRDRRPGSIDVMSAEIENTAGSPEATPGNAQSGLHIARCTWTADANTGNGNTHRGARAHDHKVKSLALCRLS